MIRSASAAAWSIGHHPQPGGLGLAHRPRPLPQPDAHVDARVLQVQGVGVALGAVADDGDLAAGDERAVGVLLVGDLAPCRVLSDVMSQLVRTARSRAAELSILGRATRPVRWSSTIP